MAEKKCLKKCRLDIEQRACLGCGRTLDEIRQAGIEARRASGRATS